MDLSPIFKPAVAAALLLAFAVHSIFKRLLLIPPSPPPLKDSSKDSSSKNVSGKNKQQQQQEQENVKGEKKKNNKHHHQQQQEQVPPLRLPPGPNPWPILGNLLQIGAFPHKSMMDFTRQFGPLVYLKLGVVPTIVTDSPAIIRDILIKQDHIFASRPENIACQYFTYNGKDIAFAPYGPHWRSMRKICTLELLSPRKIASFRDGRSQELDSMVGGIYQQILESQHHHHHHAAAARINLRDKFATLSCNTLTRMLLGKRHFGPGNAGPLDAAEHKNMIYEGFALVNAFNVADYLPFLRALDLQGHEKRMRKIMRRTDEVYDAIIEEHRQRLLKMKNSSSSSSSSSNGAAGVSQECSGNPSFVDVLLSVPEQLSTTTIKAIMIDMLSAGTDTSSVISEWAMAELALHPDELRKVQNEIDRVVGPDRVVQESDIPNLNYLKAVVKEIFRLHPVGAFLIPHFSTEDTQIAGYHIPKNTRILINTYSLGRNQSVWGDDPDVFRPQRFIVPESPEDPAASPKMVELMDSECRVIPFGAGRRSCPGASLGSCMVVMGLARLIQTFDWSAPEGGVDVSERIGFTVLNKPLELIAKPRNRRHAPVPEI